MRRERNIRRGEIWLCDLLEERGSIQGGMRPVLVIESERISRNAPTVIVAAITSVIKKAYMPSHVILPDSAGLDRTSMVMLEQIMTVNKGDLVSYIGFLTDQKTWRIINNGLKKVFGMWIYREGNAADIRCLCPSCAHDYMEAGYTIKRLDPFAHSKERCTKCEGFGYDYIVYDPRQKV